MAVTGIILKNASGASQGIGAGYDSTGAVVPTLISLPLAILVELRVMNNLSLGLVPPGGDLNVMRADELLNTCPPGSL
jgi:hypothetical protein